MAARENKPDLYTGDSVSGKSAYELRKERAEARKNAKKTSGDPTADVSEQFMAMAKNSVNKEKKATKKVSQLAQFFTTMQDAKEDLLKNSDDIRKKMRAENPKDYSDEVEVAKTVRPTQVSQDL